MVGRFLKDLKVEELKVELRRRHGKLVGRKAELAARLRELLVTEGIDPETYQFGVTLKPQTLDETQIVAKPNKVNFVDCATTTNVAESTSQHDLNNTLLAIFECPICFETSLPPIYQCANGHLVCSFCKPKITECPKCRGPPPTIRNLALEEVLSTLWLSCRNSGCSVQFRSFDKETHESECPHKTPSPQPLVPTPPPIIQVPVVDMESLDSGNVYSKPVLVEILLLRRVIRKSFGGAVVEYRVSEMELHRTSGTQTSNQIAIKVGVLKSFPLLNAGPRGMVEVRCQLVPTTVVAGQLVFVCVKMLMKDGTIQELSKFLSLESDLITSQWRRDSLPDGLITFQVAMT